MRIDSATMGRIRLALREAKQKFLFDQNVTLIDFGHPEHGPRIAKDELAIRIHVHKKLVGYGLESAVRAGQTAEIPPSIGGFPTDVPVGTYRPHAARLQRGNWWNNPAADPRAVRADPLCGGISISNASDDTFGTLGGLVIDRATGAPMILSNWHVLVGGWARRPGLSTVQPGRLDRGMWTDSVARYSRDAMSSNLDAAVAELNGERGWINDQIGVGPVRGVAVPELGMEVVKSGRRTGVTFGQVTGVEGATRMRYAGVERIIRNVVTIDPRSDGGQVSAPGDSGSTWLTAASHTALGLHFAGSDQPERALAMDIWMVLEALDVDLLITGVRGELQSTLIPFASHRQVA